MDKIVIEGVAPAFDGEYPIDLSYFTMRELHVIKLLAGVRAAELNEALEAGDTDVIVAVAVIAMGRNGVTGAEEALWDSQAGQITVVGERVDAGPPAGTPSGPLGSEPGPPGSSGSRSGVNGAAIPETTPAFTGMSG